MIKELRAKAAAAVSKAATVRDDSRPWSEKQAEFDAFVKEATDLQLEIQKAELQEKKISEFASLEQHFTKPTSRPPSATGGSGADVREAFSAYVQGGKRGLDRFAIERNLDTEELGARCDQIHAEAFAAYLRGDRQGLASFASSQNTVNPQEIHALVSNNQTLGGFLVTDQFMAEVIKAESGFAVIRSLARVINVSTETLVMPKIKPHASDSRRSSGFTGTWRAQGYVTGGTAPTIQNQPTFQQERIPVHSWQPDAIEVSTDLLDDAVVNVESIIAEAIGECKGLDEDDAFLNGTGVGQPEGILQAGLTTVQSGAATDFTYNGMVNFYCALPYQYRQRASFLMSSTSLGNLIKLNTGTGGVYIFPPNTFPTNLFGRPFYFHEGMTSPVAGAFSANDKPIIFGDFSRYIIAERQALRLQRLVERFAPNVGFLPSSRVGAQCVLTNAFRVLNIGA